MYAIIRSNCASLLSLRIPACTVLCVLITAQHIQYVAFGNMTIRARTH